MRIAASNLGLACSSLAILAGGCTRDMYPGAKRPEAEVAILEAADTKIVEIDGQRVPHGSSRYRILPGEHSITVTLRAFRPNYGEMYLSKAHLAVCFRAREGRVYRVVAGNGNGGWWPEIVDAASTLRISAHPVRRGTVGCVAREPSGQEEAAALQRIAVPRGR